MAFKAGHHEVMALLERLVHLGDAGLVAVERDGRGALGNARGVRGGLALNRAIAATMSFGPPQ